MSTIKQYSFSEFQDIMIRNGFVFIRQKGDHYIYKRNGIPETINPEKKSKDINKMLAHRLIKKHKLDVNKRR